MNIAVVERWLQEQTGLDASTLGAGVVARVARDRIDELGCTNAEEYVVRLAGSREERQWLVDRVVVPETWFFRDRPAIDALARHVVDTWGPAHPGATFRVLSVPCSTGEEPYSLAMGFALAGWPLTHLRIDAVDISGVNLARAAEGIYRRNSFRGDCTVWREGFFEKRDDAWRVGDAIRVPVKFELGNLLAGDFGVGRALYDAIFCRNLLIYFDRPTQARAIGVLRALLAPEGWLAVGPAEPVLLFEHGFSALKVPSGFLLERTRSRPAAPSTAGTAQSLALPRSSPGSPRAAHTMRPMSVPTPGKHVPLAPSGAAGVPKLEASTQPAANETVAAIRALADAGRLREAGERGAALLARSGPSAELLYLLGVVADAAGESERAEGFYRKALYLAPQHSEALSHLALLAEKRGDLRSARQLRERARRGAKEVA
jgi:chemotaxis protein methyltransferase WspC